MFTHRHAVAVFAAFALGAGTSPASASTTEKILRECAQTGTVGDGHTPAELREAAANMPADAAEYSPCPEEVDRALERALAPAERRAAAGSGAGRGLGGNGGVSADDLAAALRADGDLSGVAPTLADPITGTTPDGADPLEAAARTQAARADDAEATSPQAGDPAAKTVGNAVAAATVGASLLALARPAMLRRRRLDDAERLTDDAERLTDEA